jgi:hypothetical protein
VNGDTMVNKGKDNDDHTFFLNGHTNLHQIYLKKLNDNGKDLLVLHFSLGM